VTLLIGWVLQVDQVVLLLAFVGWWVICAGFAGAGFSSDRDLSKTCLILGVCFVLNRLKLLILLLFVF
jgi:hypothetical protein